MNIIKTALTLLLLIFLVWLISFFAGSETAYLSMTSIRVKQMLRERKKGAKKVSSLRADMDSLLTVILIGINFINTFASSIATALAIELVGNTGLGIATALITFFVTVFGEIVPKTSAAMYPEKIAVRNAIPLAVLKKIFFPVVWCFSKISKGTAFLVGKIWHTDNTIITQEELKTLIDEGEHDGTIEHYEKNMLNKIFEISDIHVHNIMKHRSLVKYIPQDANWNFVVETFKQSGFSHLPVYQTSWESVVGVLYYKDILFSKNHSSFCVEKFNVLDYITPPLFVPETFSVIDLVKVFKKENRSFAVALDEQGCTAGVVTMDDVLRVVFGRMSIGSSIREAPPEERVQVLQNGDFLVPGDMKLVDLNSVLNLNLDSEDYDTLAGWLLEKFDALPSAGEVLNYEGNLFVIEDQSQRRIVSVRVKIKQISPTKT